MSGAARREQILDVTHAIVDAEGFHAATPNRIAAEAGVTRPVLYQQFGDVAGIFVALIDREGARAADQFAEAVGAPAAVEGDGPLMRTFEGILRAIDASPASWRLFLIPPEGAPPELHQRLADSTDRVRRFIQEQLTRTFPDLADPEYAARVVHAVGRELLLLRLTEPDKATTNRLVALLREIVGQVPRRH